MDYTVNKEIIAKRIARFFENGQLVNLGIGLPTLVGNHVPPEVTILLQSENGMMGLGPAPREGEEDKDITNAGAGLVTVVTGGSFFDSATSFGIVRGGHVDYTVLGVLEVDQLGNLANYKVPGKLVPGMGGAMDLTIGARVVIAACPHFEPSGASRMKRRCTLPLTAAREVDRVVTDLGVFEVRDERFHMVECFEPYTPDWIVAHTDADVVVAPGCRRVRID
jgi:acetate CoA/acetoacetate CoA-transferase beta subunit